jgi:hypothetical protein
MNYDRMWIKCPEHLGAWHGRSEAEEYNDGDEFEATCDRLYSQGHFVVLSDGQNFIFDEMFLFQTPTEAQEFYDRGFRAREWVAEEDDEGREFQEISLYKDRRRIAAKSWAPTKRTEVHHG